jgi:acetyl-CoA carboxylase carboxyltransferase component
MFRALDLGAHPSLVSMLAPILDGASAVHGFSLDGRPHDRREADGFITLRVAGDSGAFGLVYNDFKLKGGSFSRRNSERLAAFFDQMAVECLPVVFLVDSMGIRLMDGRAVVKPAFSIIPSVSRFRQGQLLVTCNLGRALGLGAVLYAAGHYRMAIADKSLARLAGPEIVRMFFGKAPDAGMDAATGLQPPGSTLVNDVSSTRAEMLAKARMLVGCAIGEPADPPVGDGRSGFPDLRAPGRPEAKLAAVLAAVSDSATELFACLSPSVRTYLATRRGRRFGLFVNPPGNIDNLVTAHTLDRYAVALDLFRALELPLVSLIDTPGGDPRDNSDVILKLWQTTQRIIDYPYPRMGVCIGRGYGGAIVLGFPRFLGSQAAYVLQGATVGLMNAQLIDSLLAASKNLAAEWNQSRATQTADCSDLIAEGIIDACLAPADLVPALDRFLAG